MTLKNSEKNLLIPLVDEEDRVIGFETKERIHQQGLLHRAFSIFIYRSEGERIEFLLQKRAGTKYHSGNLWTNACCSHPYWDDLSLEDNAKRRLEEEFGFFCPLHKVGCFIYRAILANRLIEHELDHVFLGNYQERKGNLDPDPQEIDEYRWLSIHEIGNALCHTPETFTTWFGEAFTMIKGQFSIMNP